MQKVYIKHIVYIFKYIYLYKVYCHIAKIHSECRSRQDSFFIRVIAPETNNYDRVVLKLIFLPV